MVNYLLFQPALSVALSLAAFGLVIWPGYAVLHLLGLAIIDGLARSSPARR